jgi:hypothetical protein
MRATHLFVALARTTESIASPWSDEKYVRYDRYDIPPATMCAA